MRVLVVSARVGRVLMAETEAVTEWLQGLILVNGKERAAPQEVTDLLLGSFAEDAWDVDEILVMGRKPSVQELA